MIRHKNLVRLAIFVLMVIAFLGPWGYHHDSPPAEWCQPPFLLLENGICAGRQPGAFYLLLAAVSFPVLILGLFSSGSTQPDLLMGTLMFLIMFCMPVISTVLLLRSSASQKRIKFQCNCLGVSSCTRSIPCVIRRGHLPGSVVGDLVVCLVGGRIVGLRASDCSAAEYTPPGDIR
jgi:hypothetical protein